MQQANKSVVFVLAMCACLFAGASLGAQHTMLVDVDADDVAVDEEFVAEVLLDTEGGLAGFSFAVCHDGEILSALEINHGSVWDEVGFFFRDDGCLFDTTVPIAVLPVTLTSTSRAFAANGMPTESSAVFNTPSRSAR